MSSLCCDPSICGAGDVEKTGTGRDLAIAGATHGLRAWVAYWLVECFLWTVWPWLTTPSYEYRATHPWFPPLSLGVYMIAGATLGAALAICIGRVIRNRAETAVSFAGPLSLAVPFGILALRNNQRAQMTIAFLLTAIIVISIRRAAWLKVLRVSVNSWSAPLALLAYPFVRAQIDSPTMGYFIGISAVMVVVVAPYVTARLLKREAPPGETVQGRSLAIWAGLVVISLTLGFTLKQRPILTASPHTAVASAGKRLPNLILISMDTVRADHLSLYGYARDTSPNLQRFAQEATVFTNAVSAGDMTLSSHGSMFTGLYPSQHGAHWVLGKQGDGFTVGEEYGLRLPENSQTLAGILSARGYRTMGIVANTSYLQHAFRLDQGFEYYSQPNPVLFLELRESFYLRTILCRLIGRFCPRWMTDLDYTRAGDINRETFPLLRREETRKRPFFLFLNYMDAHAPFFPPTPYDSRYPGKDPAFRSLQYWDIESDALRQIRPYTARDKQRDESQYDGGIAYLDASLGEFFAKLKEFGLYDDSIIIVTSDHGQSFGEKQLVGHGSSVYQEQVRVPLIIKYPGSSQAAVRNNLVSHVDLLPTVLDLLGEKVPPSLPGHSLRATAALQETVFSESYPCEMMASFHPRLRRVERAAFSGPFKLILATNGKREFYDLSADPHEEHNLYSQALPVASRMESDLTRWISALPREHTRPAVLDKNGVNRLKSLGYVQ